MKKSNGFTERAIASLMCEKVNKLVDDMDRLVLDDPGQAIRIIHEEYDRACLELKTQSQF